MTLKEILVFLHNHALLCDEQYENDKAIRLCNRIEQNRNCIKQIFYPDVSENVWDSLVVASGLSFQNDHIVSFTLKEMDDFQEQWTKNNMDEFFKHVLYRKVYT